MELTGNQFTHQNPEHADPNGDPTPVDSQAPSYIGSEKDPDLENAKHMLPPPGMPKEEEILVSQNSSQGSQDLPPPDGGLQAWLQVLGTHALIMVTWWAPP